MNRVVAFLALVLLAAPVQAAAPIAAPAPIAPAPLIRDLGRNLLYHRVQALPADLPAADPTRKRPMVLDLRYATGDAAAASSLVAWLKGYATVRTPVFVLANGETARPVRQALAGRGAAGSVLVIGAAAREFDPDLAVQTTAETDRRAYDALAAGVEPATLITENSDKARNDEASLARDRPPEPGSAAARDTPPPPPVDAALQRAVHLHRTLVALKKI